MSSISDLDSYRQPWESDEHWELRKEFLEKYREDFDEDRLLCLAQVYANVELLECSYPEPVMKQIQDLTRNMTMNQSVKNARQERVSIHFVKAKKQKTDHNPDSQSTVCRVLCDDENPSKTPTQHDRDLIRRASYLVRTFTNRSCLKALDDVKRNLNVPMCYKHESDSRKSSNSEGQHCCKVILGDIMLSEASSRVSRHNAQMLAAQLAIDSLVSSTSELLISEDGRVVLKGPVNKGTLNTEEHTEIDCCMEGIVVDPARENIVGAVKGIAESEGVPKFNVPNLPKDFILVENTSISDEVHPVSQLMSSASFCKKNLQFEYSNEGAVCCCRILFEGNIIAQAIDGKKNEAKKMAAEKALKELKKTHFTIKVKNTSKENSLIPRSYVFGLSGSDYSLPETNVGCQILKKMGWTGGAIQKHGISEPISCGMGNSWGAGLGFSSAESETKELRKKIEDLLRRYSKSKTTLDLMFATDFSKTERKTIHEMASRFGLKSASYGKDEERHLVISRKFRPVNLINLLMESGGSTEKYDLIPPSIGSDTQ